MKWKNLEQNKCPGCSGDFYKTIVMTRDTTMIVCKCGFKIAKLKYQEIVASRISKRLTDQEKKDIFKFN